MDYLARSVEDYSKTPFHYVSTNTTDSAWWMNGVYKSGANMPEDSTGLAMTYIAGLQQENVNLRNQLQDQNQTINGLKYVLMEALGLKLEDFDNINVHKTVKKIARMKKQIGTEGVREA